MFGDLFPNIDNNEILIQKLLKSSELYTDLNYKFQTECQFNQMIHSIGKNVQLSVFHINICSLNANCSKLCQLLAILEINFDVLVLSEISDFNIEFYSKLLSNYKFYKDLPTDSHRGGIGIIIHDSIECKERLDLKIQNTDVNKIENLWFDIIKDKQNFIVGGLYRHPSQFIKNFSDSIGSTLNQISNINLLNHETHQGTRDNLNTMLLNNCLPMLLSPTRINRISSTLIDQIYFFQGKQDVMTHSGTLSVEVADHLPNYVLIVGSKHTSSKLLSLPRLFPISLDCLPGF